MCHRHFKHFAGYFVTKIHWTNSNQSGFRAIIAGDKISRTNLLWMLHLLNVKCPIIMRHPNTKTHNSYLDRLPSQRSFLHPKRPRRLITIFYEVKIHRKPCQSSTIRYLCRQKICLDRKRKLQWSYTKLLIIASTLPVITAGKLKANRLQRLPILFMSTSEMFSEGVTLPQSLHFCQSFINYGKNLNLLASLLSHNCVNKLFTSK